jgi:hypothetical protein
VIDIIASAGSVLKPVGSASMRYWLSGDAKNGLREIPYATLLGDPKFKAAHQSLRKKVISLVCAKIQGKQHERFVQEFVASGIGEDATNVFVMNQDLWYAYRAWDHLYADVRLRRTGTPCENNPLKEWVQVNITYHFQDRYDWERGELTHIPFTGTNFDQDWAVDLLECTRDNPDLVPSVVPTAPKDYFTIAKVVANRCFVCCKKRGAN